jgi:hypothetical protein
MFKKNIQPLFHNALTKHDIPLLLLDTKQATDDTPVIVNVPSNHFQTASETDHCNKYVLNIMSCHQTAALPKQF